MRRIFGWLFLVGVISIGLLWPMHLPDDVCLWTRADPVMISNYRVDFTVAADGPSTRSRPSGGISGWPTRDLPLLGRHQSEQPPGTSAARDHLHPDGRRAGALRAVMGIGRPVWGRQDRGPGHHPAPGPRVYELRYTIPGSSTRGTRPGRAIRPRRRQSGLGVDLLLERHRTVLEQHHPACWGARHAARRVTGASARSGRGRRGPAPG